VTVEQLRSLVAYNRSANNRLLEAAAALGVEELERDLRASFDSLRGTLIHILWGERGWLHFWQAGVFLPDPLPGDYPDFASLRSAWTHHQEAYAAWLLGLTQPELDAPRSVDANTYSLGELVQHTLNHSNHHRGQVTLLLRQLGYNPPPTDYRDFLTETRYSVRSASDGSMRDARRAGK
jgi:uncharacterized damage-inducible protein DinB